MVGEGSVIPPRIVTPEYTSASHHGHHMERNSMFEEPHAKLQKTEFKSPIQIKYPQTAVTQPLQPLQPLTQIQPLQPQKYTLSPKITPSPVQSLHLQTQVLPQSSHQIPPQPPPQTSPINQPIHAIQTQIQIPQLPSHPQIHVPDLTGIPQQMAQQFPQSPQPHSTNSPSTPSSPSQLFQLRVEMRRKSEQESLEGLVGLAGLAGLADLAAQGSARLKVEDEESEDEEMVPWEDDERATAPLKDIVRQLCSQTRQSIHEAQERAQREGLMQRTWENPQVGHVLEKANKCIMDALDRAKRGEASIYAQFPRNNVYSNYQKSVYRK